MTQITDKEIEKNEAKLFKPFNCEELTGCGGLQCDYRHVHLYIKIFSAIPCQYKR